MARRTGWRAQRRDWLAVALAAAVVAPGAGMSLIASAATRAIDHSGAPSGRVGAHTNAACSAAQRADPDTGSTDPLSTIGTDQIRSFWVMIDRGARQLRTYIAYPVVAPARPLPVLVFAHGWDNSPGGYATILRAWATAGFVTVAPTAPGMAAGLPLVNEGVANADQLADLPYVLTYVLHHKMPFTPDASDVVYAGHSDGGDTVAALAFNPRYRDPRARGFLILSGGTDTDDTFYRSNVTPVFIADSYADQFHNWPSAQRFFDLACAPKVLVGIGRGETHLQPWVEPTAFNLALWQAAVDFSAWAFTGDPASRAQMAADLDEPGMFSAVR
jgi:acetyl esterase/lipase